MPAALTLKIQDTLNQASDDESLGFRNITMELVNTSSRNLQYLWCNW